MNMFVNYAMKSLIINTILFHTVYSCYNMNI